MHTQTIGHAALAVSFSVPRATTFIASSGSRRCNAFASSHGARIQMSHSFCVVRITGMALGWIGSTALRRRRREAVREVRSGDRFRLGTPVAFELGPDAAEREKRSVI